MDSGRSVPVTNTIYCILIVESNEWWADDASDFDMSSDDSEDEDSLCNTVMLTGPSGVGKTASVYALAQELGFKVGWSLV